MGKHKAYTKQLLWVTEMLKQKTKKKALHYSLSFLLVFHPFLAGALHAAPTGGTVVAGSGSITQNNNQTLIQQNTDKLALNWQTFNVGSQEQVTFNQPSSSSIALNNILDQNPSQIFGSLDANGQVFLTNPNGIIFAPGATLNVGGLVASGMRMNINDFMQDNYRFENEEGVSAGRIINYGTLNAASGGSVNLIGGSVRNEGLIAANYGQVNLISGETVVVDFDGDGLMQFQVERETLTNAAAVDEAIANTGQINADGGQVVLSGNAAEDVFSKAINNEGLIQAMRIDNSGGSVRLVGTGTVIHSGDINVNGDENSTGGSVHVLGDKVGLFDHASVEASGPNGGGEVLVGGGYQGNNAAIKNSEFTYVSQDSNITANATETGDGGKVIVWADNSTQYYGDIEAKGGSQDGNGGLAEVSGKEYLAFQGQIDLSAENGNKGSLLLDPRNITISTAASSAGGVAGNDQFADNSAGDSIINVTDLENAIDSADVTLQAHTDITVTDAVDASGGTANNLNLEAGDDIILNNSISLANGATLSLLAGSPSASPVGADGTPNIRGSGVLSASTINLEATGDIGTTGTDIETNTTQLNVIVGDDFYINNSANLSDLSLSTTDTVNGDITSTGLSTFNLSRSGSNINDIDVDDDGLNLSLTHTNNIDLGTIDLNGTLTLDTSGSITQVTGGQIVSGATNIVKNGSGTFTIGQNNTYTGSTTVNAGTLVLDDANQIGTGAIVLNSGTFETTSTMTLANNITLGTGGATLNTNANDVTASGLISGSTDLTKLGSGTLTLNNAGNNAAHTGATNIDGGAISIASANNIGSGTISLAGTELEATGTFTLANALNLGLGGGTINTGANDVSATGLVTGSTDLTKTGSGKLTLSNTGNNANHSGATLINAGSLSIGAASHLGNGALSLAGSELETTAALSLANAINLGTGGGTINTAGNDVTASGQITGSTDLTKSGTGVLSLSSTNNSANHSGATHVNGGSVSIGASTHLGSGALNLNNGALETTGAITLTNAINLGVGGGSINTGVNDITASGQISGSSDLTKTGSGKLTLSNTGNSANHSGETLINAGTLSIASSNNISSGDITLTGSELETTGATSLSNDIIFSTGGGTINTNANDLTLSGILQGSSDLSKTGSGELTLSNVGNNTNHSGNIDIAGGNIIIATSDNIGQGTISLAATELEISNATTLNNAINLGTGGGTLNTTNNVTINGVISGSTDLTKTGTGTLTLGNAGNSASHSGATQINAGAISLASAGHIGTGSINLDNSSIIASGAFSLNQSVNLGAGGGTIDTNGNDVSLSGLIIGSSDFNKAGNGVLTLSNLLNSTNHSGETHIDGGSIAISDAGQISTAALRLNTGTLETTADLSLGNAINLEAGGGTINTNANDISLSGQITGTSDLNKTGSGQLTLSNVNNNANHSGTTNINAGKISIGSASNIGSGTIALAGAELETTGAFTLANAISIGASGASINTNANNLTASGQISGTGDLSKLGSGTLTLSNLGTNANHSGATLVNAGALSIGSASNVGSGAITLAATELEATGAFSLANDINLGAGGGTINTNTNDITVSGLVSGSADLTKTGSGTLSLSNAGNNSNHSGNNNINDGSISIAASGNIGSGAINLDGSELETTGLVTLANDINLGLGGGTINTSTDVTASGLITGSSNLSKTGAGTLSLNNTGNATSHTGALLVNGGLLGFGDTSHISSQDITLNGGGLQTNAALTIANNLILGAGGGSLNTNGNDVTLSGLLSGSSSFSKAGNGVLTLANLLNSTNHTGSTQIDGGSLLLSDLSQISSNAIHLDSGELITDGDLNITNNINLETGGGSINTGTNNVTLNGLISGATQLAKEGSGQLTLNNIGNSVAHSGDTAINGGTLNVAATTNIGTGTINLSGGELALLNSLTLANAISIGTGGGTINTDVNDITISGQLSGSNDLSKTGSGSLTLSNTGNNASHSGQTLINQGSLSIGSSDHLGSGALTLDGSTLITTGDLTLANDLVVGPGDASLDIGANNISMSGLISGANDLNKNGSGTLTLSNTGNSSSHTGNTNVNGGTLNIGANTQIGSGTIYLDGSILNTSADMALLNAINLGAGGGTLDTNGHTINASGTLSGASDFTKSGSGSLILSNSSTSTSHTGATTINAGSISIASTNNISAGAINFNNSELITTADISLTNALNLGATNGTLNTEGNTVSADGAISGTGDLIKEGSGVLALTSTANGTLHSGDTLINDGVLSLGATSNLGTGDLIFNNSTLLALASFNLINNLNLSANAVVNTNGNDVLANGTIFGTGSLTKIGAGDWHQTSALNTVTHTGNTIVDNGTLTISSGNSLGGSGTLSLDNESVLNVTNNSSINNNIFLGSNNGGINTNANTVNLNGTVLGSGDLTKLGTGNLVLQSAASYSGDTNINSGTITTLGDNFLASNNISITNGVLALNGVETFDSIALNSGTVQGNGASYATSAMTLDGNSFLSGTALIDINGDLSQNSGTLNSSASTIYLEGDLINSAAAPANTLGALVLDGATDQTIDLNGSSVVIVQTDNQARDITLDGSFDSTNLIVGTVNDFSIIGDTVNITNASTFHNTGTLYLGNASTDVIGFSSTIAHTAGDTQIHGQVDSTAGDFTVMNLNTAGTATINSSAVTISGATTLANDSTLNLNASGDVYLNTVTGNAAANVENLTVASGGILTLDGLIDTDIGTVDITASDIHVLADVNADNINIGASTGRTLIVVDYNLPAVSGTLDDGTTSYTPDTDSLQLNQNELNHLTADDGDSNTTTDLLTLESDTRIYLTGDLTYNNGDNGVVLDSAGDILLGGMRYDSGNNIYNGLPSTWTSGSALDGSLAPTGVTFEFEALSAVATEDIYTFDFELFDINGSLSLDAGQSLFLNTNPFLASGVDNGISLDSSIEANNIAFAAATPVVLNDPLSIEAVGTGNIDFSGLTFIRGSTPSIDASFQLTTNGGDITVGDLGTEATPIDNVILDALGTSGGPAGNVFINGAIYTNDAITIEPTKNSGIILLGDSTLSSAGLLNVSAIDGSHNSMSNGFDLNIISDSSVLADITDVTNLSVTSTSTSAQTTIDSVIDASSITLDGLFVASSALAINSDTIDITGELENSGGDLSLTADTVITNGILSTDSNLLINSSQSTLQGQLISTGGNIDLSDANTGSDIQVAGSGLALQADTAILGGTLQIGGATTGITLANGAGLDFTGVSNIELTTDGNFVLENGDLNFGTAAFVDNTLGGVDLNVSDAVSAIGGGSVTLNTINETVRSVSVITANDIQLAGSMKTLDGITLVSDGGNIATNLATETILDSSNITLGGTFTTVDSSVQLNNSGGNVSLDAGADLDLSNVILNGDLSNPAALNIDSMGHNVILGDVNAHSVNLDGLFTLTDAVMTSAQNSGVNIEADSDISFINNAKIDTFTNNADGIGGSINIGDNVNIEGTSGSLTMLAGTGITMSSTSVISADSANLSLTSNSGNVTLGALNTADGNITVTAQSASVVSAFDSLENSSISSELVNLAANTVTINSSNKIGESSNSPIIISANDEINLDLGASEAFILNLNNVPINSNDNIVDVFNDRFNASNAAEATGLQASATFTDFDEYTSDDPDIIQVLSATGLTDDDDEENRAEFEISSLTPEVPAMIKTLKGWSFIRASARKGEAQQDGSESGKSNRAYKRIEWLDNEFKYSAPK